jgi:penicillin-binding protein 2
MREDTSGNNKMFNQYFKNRRMQKGIEIEDSIMTITQEEKALIEAPFNKKGLTIIWYFMVLILMVMVGRVFYLDFFRGQYYSDISRENRIRSLAIKAPRGNILDKSGHILARNAPSLDAVIVPNYLPLIGEDHSAMVAQLADTLEMNSGNVEAILDSQDRKSPDPVLLKENISQDQALILSEKASILPGIYIELTAIRNYEDSQIFAPIIGYDGKITREELDRSKGYLMTDYIGKAGI